MECYSFQNLSFLSYRPDEGQDLHASSCDNTTYSALLFMAVEQKQRDKGCTRMTRMTHVSILRCIPLSTEVRFKPSSSIDYYYTIMTLKSSKPRYVRIQKYLNLCFQRGFSKNLDISRKRGMGFARSRFSLKISIVLKTPYKTLSCFTRQE